MADEMNYLSVFQVAGAQLDSRVHEFIIAYLLLDGGSAACGGRRGCLAAVKGVLAKVEELGLSNAFFGDPGFPQLVLSLDEERNFVVFEKEILADFSRDASLAEFLMSVDRKVRAHTKKVRAPYFAALRQGLGYYTSEEEADTLTVEFAALLGWDPVIYTKIFLSEYEFLWRSGQSRNSEVSLSPKECQRLALADWQDSTGVPALVPLGVFWDVHHNPCYRAWNTHQEIIAHDYQAFAQRQEAFPLLSDAAFQALVREFPFLAWSP